MSKQTTDMKKCTNCKETKTLDEFNKRTQSKDGLQSTCRICNRKQARAYYAANKEAHSKKIYASKVRRLEANRKKLLAFLAENPCIDCGYTNELALDFDHVHGKKKANVTTLLKEGYSWKIIKAEINKCEVRCRNCHSIKTHLEQKSYRSRML